VTDKIVCLVGPSGSGKTTIAYELKRLRGYNVIESFTTRPPRFPGERGHTFMEAVAGAETKDSIFMPSEDVIAYNKYDGHHYWATRDQYQGKGISIYVIDPPGVKMLQEQVKDAEILVVMMWADEELRRLRMYERERSRQRKISMADYHRIHSSIDKRIEYDRNVFGCVTCDIAVCANEDIYTVKHLVDEAIS